MTWKVGDAAVTKGTQFLPDGTRVQIIEAGGPHLEDPRGDKVRVRANGYPGSWYVMIRCLKPAE